MRRIDRCRSAVGHHVHDVAVRVPEEEPPDPPVLVLQLVHDLGPGLAHQPLRLVDVVHRDGDDRVHRRRGVPGDGVQLDARTTRCGQETDPAEVSVDGQAERVRVEPVGRGDVGDGQVRNDPFDPHAAYKYWPVLPTVSIARPASVPLPPETSVRM